MNLQFWPLQSSAKTSQNELKTPRSVEGAFALKTAERNVRSATTYHDDLRVELHYTVLCIVSIYDACVCTMVHAARGEMLAVSLPKVCRSRLEHARPRQRPMVIA